MKKIKNMAKAILSIFLLCILIFSAERVRTSCFDALLICGRLIIPALFPFLVLSAFITKLGIPGIFGRLIYPLAGRLYGISPYGASAMVMGFVGGYPTGAAYIASLEAEELISADEGERLIAFCNNSGPAFIIGVMGLGVFHSAKTGLILYASHICSALITGLLFREKAKKFPIPQNHLDDAETSKTIVAAVKQAVSSIINICGFVICFSVLIAIMDSGNNLTLICNKLSQISSLEPQFFRVLLSGFLEIGSGSAEMSGLSPTPFNLALSAAMLGWGGLSVHFQTLAVLSGSKIKGSLHIAGRLSSAAIAFIMMYIVAAF